MNITNVKIVRKSISFLTLFILLASCKVSQKQTESVRQTATMEQTSEVKDLGITFMNPEKKIIFQHYLKVKDALFNSDAVETKNAAEELANKVSEVKVKKPAMEIASTDDIVLQRKAFKLLSIEMESLLTGSLVSGEIYRQHCHMAFRNTGAIWLSDSSEILNPYYGKIMPDCGTVKGTIK